MSLSKVIKNLRKSSNLTQAEFAKQFNISNGTIAMWETGKRHPDHESLVRIADYFNVPIDYLLGRPLPNLKLADVLNNLRGEKELTVFLNECGLNENEIKITQENPKALEIATLKKIFEHSNKQISFEQLLFSIGKTYEDLVAEATSKFKRLPQQSTLSNREVEALTTINRADDILGVEFVDMILNVLNIIVEQRLKEKK